MYTYQEELGSQGASGDPCGYHGGYVDRPSQLRDIADGRIGIHPPEVFGHVVRIYPLEVTVG